MSRWTRRIEVDGTWWAQDASGAWHRWDPDTGDWTASERPPLADTGDDRYSSKRGFSWRFRRGRPGDSSLEVSLSGGGTPPETRRGRYSGFIELDAERSAPSGVETHQRYIRLRRKRPGSLREAARFFGLLTLVLADIALVERQLLAFVICITIAAALLAYWWLTPLQPRYMADLPYASREPPWENAPGPEVLPEYILRPARARIAALLGGSVFVLWCLMDPSLDQMITALAPAGAVVILGYEIPIRPVPWVVAVSLVFAGLVALIIGGIGLLFPWSEEGLVSVALFTGTAFVTAAAFAYTVLQIVVVIHRVEKRERS